MRILFIALFMVLSTHVSAQEVAQPALEGQPVATHGQKESAPANEEDAAAKQHTSADLTTALNGIESAIRDLITASDKPESDRDKDREVRDLNAQESMALWAKLMFWATLATVGAAVVGIVYVRRTLHETRRIGQAQVRAYLSVTCKPPNFCRGEIPVARAKVVNGGQSPAINCRYIAILIISEGELSRTYKGDVITPANGQKIPATVVAVGGKFTVIAGRGQAISEAEWGEIRDGVKVINLAMHIYYDDVFGNAHITKFCASARFTEIPATDARYKDHPRRGALYEVGWMTTPTHNSAT